MGDGFFGNRQTIDRLSGRRDKQIKGSKGWNRIQNRINKLSGDDTQHSSAQTEYQASLNSPNQGSNINKGYEPEVAMNKNFGDTSKFDVGNQQDVMKMQRMLVNKGLLAPTYTDRDGNEVNSIDGKFGDDTQGAYRNMMHMSREAKGEDRYTYENEADPNSQFKGSEQERLDRLDAPVIDPNTGKPKTKVDQTPVPFLPDVTRDKDIDRHIAENNKDGVYLPNVEGQFGMQNANRPFNQNTTGENIYGALQDTGSKYKDKGTDIYNSAKEFSGDVYDALGDTGQMYKDKATDIWNATSDWFGEKWGGDK